MVKKINGNVIVTEKDIILYEGLIKNDMLNYYIVSLISSDNEDTQENWTKNKKELLKLKSFIEKSLITNKKHIQKQLNEAIEIVNKELKKYYGNFQ